MCSKSSYSYFVIETFLAPSCFAFVSRRSNTLNKDTFYTRLGVGQSASRQSSSTILIHPYSIPRSLRYNLYSTLLYSTTQLARQSDFIPVAIPAQPLSAVISCIPPTFDYRSTTIPTSRASSNLSYLNLPSVASRILRELASHNLQFATGSFPLSSGCFDVTSYFLHHLTILSAKA